MKWVAKFFDGVYCFFMTSCKLAFIGMVVITTYVVFNRFFIKSSLVWGEPIVLMCMVYMSLVSAALAIRNDTHIRMSVIDFIVPEKVVSVMRGAAQVGIFGFGVFMIVYGWKFSMLAGRNTITGVGIKSMWLYLTCPAAGIAVCLMEMERLINYFDRRRRGIILHGNTVADDAKALVEDAAEQIRETEGKSKWM
ncbi:TRAP-type C4-dicarboxylate transport system permease small subunit [Anaerosolibacter carboniphilus]|uniref:TRAP-type C4-dicarboxylate transport system permease small subunit n=1 Tax=Anaerosolibacter carboniphilus TaxID=1417629 RepID=A0A841KWL9_9FIRM|nr:TRAP transporter small permease [Anaerosolibacter carboniphilus]MBB6215322.1 TRAP-type C4-dicarboxylate transport system permease small subunit [Anaerosolibacter carboniphilus]